MNKYIVFFFIFGFSFSSFAQKKKAKIVSKPLLTIAIRGKITETFSYCGGAPPPAELLAELNTPKPACKYTIFFRRDSNDLKKPIFKEMMTDSAGRFELRLPPGKYVIVDAKKKDLETYQNTISHYKKETNDRGAIDILCYNQFIATPDYVLIVPKSTKKSYISMEINYFRSCNWSGHPCVEYRGPLPP